MPIVALLLCWLDLLPAEVSQIIAGGVIVVRLASVGVWVERLHGNRPSWRMITVGLVSAAFCAVIVFIKVFFVGPLNSGVLATAASASVRACASRPAGC